MKINLTLLLKIALTEMVFYLSMFLMLVFLHFFIFGSGAGAESANALLFDTIATYIIILTPLLFNLYKIIKFRNCNYIKSFTYIMAELVMLIFLILLFSFNYIGT